MWADQDIRSEYPDFVLDDPEIDHIDVWEGRKIAIRRQQQLFLRTLTVNNPALASFVRTFAWLEVGVLSRDESFKSACTMHRLGKRAQALEISSTSIRLLSLLVNTRYLCIKALSAVGPLGLNCITPSGLIAPNAKTIRLEGCIHPYLVELIFKDKYKVVVHEAERARREEKRRCGFRAMICVIPYLWQGQMMDDPDMIWMWHGVKFA